MRSVGAALVAGLIALSAAPIAAQPARPPLTDLGRGELIARVQRSVVHVKAVSEPPAPPAPVAESKRSRSRPKTPLGLEEFLRNFSGKDPRAPRREEGTGFVYDGARDLVVTAAHIVDKAKTLTVVLPGGVERPATLAGIDPRHGVAVLHVPGLDLPALPLAARSPRTGETTIVVGWMIAARSILASQGMVMGAFATEALTGAESIDLARYHALDNLLPNGGFGGSPAVDADGNVIGLVSAIFSAGGFGQQALTLVIAVDRLRPVVEAMLVATPANP